MAKDIINIPNSQSGLVSYNNLPSNNKLQISPTLVMVIIGLTVIAEAIIKIIF